VDDEPRAGSRFDHVLRTLLEEIDNGTFPSGALLPPQRHLAERFGVSRDTVQRVLRELRDQGHVESRQGSGTRVIRPSGDSGRPGRHQPRVALGPHMHDAFHARAVTIDVFSLTGETLDPHLRLSAERIRVGDLRAPESISVRLLLARADGDHGLLRSVDDPEDRRALVRLRTITARTTASMGSTLRELQLEGYVPRVRFDVSQSPLAPLQKFYLLNATDVLTGYYQVVQRRLLFDTGEEVEAHDVLGLGSALHHHSAAGERPDPEGVALVNSAKRWYEHAWANASPAGTD
jgi:DNA-binding transcriptional ArsR family regulator